MRTEKLAGAFDVTISYVHFPLHPDTPSEGRRLEDLFNCGSDEIAAKNQQMLERMAAEGLPYGPRTHTYNSRLAQELAKWAETQAGGDAIHDAMYRAYFVDGCNVGDEKVLLDIAGSVGLDVDEARAVLAERRYSKAVDADWAKSRQMGVTGVPTFVAGGLGVVGAQPYSVLEHLMLEVGARPSGP